MKAHNTQVMSDSPEKILPLQWAWAAIAMHLYSCIVLSRQQNQKAYKLLLSYNPSLIIDRFKVAEEKTSCIVYSRGGESVVYRLRPPHLAWWDPNGFLLFCESGPFFSLSPLMGRYDLRMETGPRSDLIFRIGHFKGKGAFEESGGRSCWRILENKRTSGSSLKPISRKYPGTKDKWKFFRQ